MCICAGIKNCPGLAIVQKYVGCTTIRAVGNIVIMTGPRRATVKGLYISPRPRPTQPHLNIKNLALPINKNWVFWGTASDPVAWILEQERELDTSRWRTVVNQFDLTRKYSCDLGHWTHDPEDVITSLPDCSKYLHWFKSLQCRDLFTPPPRGYTPPCDMSTHPLGRTPRGHKVVSTSA